MNKTNLSLNDEDLYNDIVNPDLNKKVRVVLKEETYQASGNGENLLQDVNRANEKLIDMQIEGKSEQEQKFNLFPTIEKPLPFVSKTFSNGNVLSSIDDYRDKLYNDEIIEKNIYRDFFDENDEWELYKDENDFYVYTLKNEYHDDYLDYSLDHEFNTNKYNANLPIANSKVICNCFENTNNVSREGIWVDNDSNMYLRVKKDRINTTINELLVNNNVEYMYVLDKPFFNNIFMQMIDSENVNVLFDCDVHIENNDIMIDRDNVDFTQKQELISEYRNTLPIELLFENKE